MKEYLVILREPDGRLEPHDAIELKAHRLRMKEWFQKHFERGNIKAGSALTLNGKQIKGREAEVINDIHQVGTEIVGGYILINALTLDEAVNIMRSCPVFEFDSYAEIRELMQT
jgi:hypothetical protein